LFRYIEALTPRLYPNRECRGIYELGRLGRKRKTD
jgi:hypothetical protein